MALKKIVLIGGLWMLSQSLLAQQFSILQIPDSLLKNCNVIKRMDERMISIKDKGKATYSYKVAYTILNEKADDFGMLQVSYDRFFREPTIEATLYDIAGNKIRSIKKSEIRDLSGQGGATDISDDRVKECAFYHREYPYTVYYEVEQDYNGLMFLPAHFFINSDRMSVQQSSLTVSYPASLMVRHKSFGFPGKPTESVSGDRKVMTWELKNLKPVLGEYASPPWLELSPSIFLAMDQFEMGNYKGSYTSWEAFGNFVYQLIGSRDALPEELKTKVHAIADGVSSKEQKVEALYRFMQQNTRYISVQLGIGGWQPFDAKYVYERKYGDCKALTNYMHAVLKEVGISSIYTLVKAGGSRKSFLSDFPSSQFNHAFLCVPLEKDTMWLECTSQDNAPGYLSDFTSGRPVLLVKENGSKLVYTPDYKPTDNRQVRKVDVQLEANGHLNMKMQGLYTGLQHDPLQGRIRNLSAGEMKQALHDEFDIGTYELIDFAYEEKQARIPSVHESISLRSTSYAQRTGKRIFINPNLVTKHGTKLEEDSTRLYDILLSTAYQDIDTVRIQIPEGFRVENLPPAKEIKTDFGSYQAACKVEDNMVVYTRTLTRKNGRFPASAFDAFRQFNNDMYRADRQKLVLVAKE